jgi:hypothetical protein
MRGSGAKRRLSNLLAAPHQSLKEDRVFRGVPFPKSRKLPGVE